MRERGRGGRYHYSRGGWVKHRHVKNKNKQSKKDDQRREFTAAHIHVNEAEVIYLESHSTQLFHSKSPSELFI